MRVQTTPDPRKHPPNCGFRVHALSHRQVAPPEHRGCGARADHHAPAQVAAAFQRFPGPQPCSCTSPDRKRDAMRSIAFWPPASRRSLQRATLIACLAGTLDLAGCGGGGEVAIGAPIDLQLGVLARAVTYAPLRHGQSLNVVAQWDSPSRWTRASPSCGRSPSTEVRPSPTAPRRILAACPSRKSR